MSLLLVINAPETKMDKLITDDLLVMTDAWKLACGMFLIMVLCTFFGRRVAIWRKKAHVPGQDDSSSTTMSATLGLMAFLLAFTFGMSSGRFDSRRSIIVSEANAIGTAILRADMYDEPHRSAFRKDFRTYLEARIQYYNLKTNLDHVEGARIAARQSAKRLWARATTLSRDPYYESATRQMVPELNEMFDLATTRLIGELSRVPGSITWMLFILAWASAFYHGYTSVVKGKLDWFPAMGFCLLISLVIYITLDLDRPRRGFIQLSTAQYAMEELMDQFTHE